MSNADRGHQRAGDSPDFNIEKIIRGVDEAVNVDRNGKPPPTPAEIAMAEARPMFDALQRHTVGTHSVIIIPEQAVLMRAAIVRGEENGDYAPGSCKAFDELYAQVGKTGSVPEHLITGNMAFRLNQAIWDTKTGRLVPLNGALSNDSFRANEVPGMWGKNSHGLIGGFLDWFINPDTWRSMTIGGAGLMGIVGCFLLLHNLNSQPPLPSQVPPKPVPIGSLLAGPNDVLISPGRLDQIGPSLSDGKRVCTTVGGPLHPNDLRQAVINWGGDGLIVVEDPITKNGERVGYCFRVRQ